VINIYARDRIALFGDSITAQVVFNNLQTAVTAFYTALYGANDPRIPQWFNLGVVSDTAALEDARTGQVDNVCPTAIIYQGVQNDCSGATANGAFTTSYTSILTKFRTKWPRVRLLCTNSFALNEQWPSGFGANTFDKAATGIEAKNAIIAPIIAQFGGELIDFRGVYTIREPAANPSNLVTGVFLTDMPHPNAAGQAVLSLEALSHISMQPSDFPIARPWLGA
jgi:lysophospholipase L1-like esterase